MMPQSNTLPRCEEECCASSAAAREVNVKEERKQSSKIEAYGFKKHKLLYSLLATCFVIGVLFRLNNLEQREYYIDEALTSLNVAGFTYKDVLPLQSANRIIKMGDLQKYQEAQNSPIRCISALAKNGGEHPPLYFLLSWAWQNRFGNEVHAMRLLPAIISIFLIPCTFLFFFELFRDSSATDSYNRTALRTATIASCIVTLSPFQLLYAQYARQYSLWITLTALTSYLLLRSLRSGMSSCWIAYCATSVLSLFTHPFAAMVGVAQLLYTCCVNKLRLSKQVAHNAIGLSIAGLLFLPWATQMLIHKQVSDEMLKWLTRRVSMQSLTEAWLNNLNHLYFQLPGYEIVLTGLTVLLTVSGAFSLWKNGKKQFAYALCLILSVLLPLALPDIIYGGVRSQTPRYLIPCALGFLIPVAFLLGNLVAAKTRTLRFTGYTLLSMFLSLELLSSMNIARASEHADLPMHQVTPREIAKVLNQADTPLVICPIGRKYMSYMLTLSHYVNPEVKLLVCSSKLIPDLPNGFKSLYIFNPTYECFTRFQKSAYFQIEELPNLKTLWLMRYSGPTKGELGGNNG